MLALFSASYAYSQGTAEARGRFVSAAVSKVATSGGKVGVIVITSAGKALWETGRFTATRIAWPVTKAMTKQVAKRIVVPALKKAVPLAARFAIL